MLATTNRAGSSSSCSKEKGGGKVKTSRGSSSGKGKKDRMGTRMGTAPRRELFVDMAKGSISIPRIVTRRGYAGSFTVTMAQISGAFVQSVAWAVVSPVWVMTTVAVWRPQSELLFQAGIGGGPLSHMSSARENVDGSAFRVLLLLARLGHGDDIMHALGNFAVVSHIVFFAAGMVGSCSSGLVLDGDNMLSRTSM